MTQGSQRVRAAGWLARADPAGLLYGAIVSAAVLATVSAHAEGSEFVALATAMVLVVYWMAHVYIHALSRQFDGDARHFLLRLRTSSGHETSVLKGGVPAILVYLGAYAAGLDIGSAAAMAVYFTVVLLAAVGYLGAHQAGLRGRAVLLEVGGAASFGVLIVAAKALLH
ncbi:MAG: hypothetical protein ABWY19_09850 [Marmoricola sp.]